MIYNINMKVENLLENGQAEELFERFLPGLKNVVQKNGQAAQLSIEQLIRYSRVPKAEEVIAAMDKALKELNTPENAITPSEAKQIAYFQQIDREDRQKAAKTETHCQKAIYPGRAWLDTKGERIQAHGGSVFYEEGVYYWYGENKEHTDGRNGIWTWGIKVYSSVDLCNWTDRGYLIPPVLENPNSSLFPTKRVDRPHILKCEKTGKYVCWIKLSGADAAFTVWQADSLLGQYEMIENMYYPGNHRAGDFDMIADAESGKGYLYFDADHKAMICMELTEDYLHAGCETSRSYQELHPPFTREAPALFEAGGKKYMLTSGMTGYIPNKSDAAVAAHWAVPFLSIGNPHVGDTSEASFNSQISKVFRVEGRKDLYVAMADRWIPQYQVDSRIADLFTRVIASKYNPQKYMATEEERKEMYAANVLETADTSVADYVWLPVRINGSGIEIHWLDEWKPDDYQ